MYIKTELDNFDLKELVQRVFFEKDCIKVETISSSIYLRSTGFKITHPRGMVCGAVKSYIEEFERVVIQGDVYTVEDFDKLRLRLENM